MIGKAAPKPTQRLILNVTRNGSTTPNVVRRFFLSAGSGPLSHCRMWCWKTNATAPQTTRATSETMMRDRNSSRCSTSVASSPWRRRRGNLICQARLGGVVLACRRWSGRLAGRGCLELGADLVDVLVGAGHRILELAHSLTHGAADLRQPLRAEEQERQQQQKDDLAGSDVSEHAVSIAGSRESDHVPAGGPADCWRLPRVRLPWTIWTSTVRSLSGKGPLTRGTARDQEPARRPRGRHRDRQGCRPRGRPEPEARDHGPERIGQVDARVRPHG